MNIAGNHKGLPPTYYYPYSVDSAKAARNPWLDFELKHLELTGDSLYLTDRLTNEAISYIRQQKDSAFFLYLPFYTVHTPIEGRKDLVEKYTQKLEAHNDSVIRNPHFLAMVECMDENIGELLHVLDTLAILENTLIIFVSDNGGLIRQDENGAYLASYNYPLRAGKGTLYEGGLRVPTIIHWPEKFQKGFASNELIISTDIYPTIMDILDIPPGENIEGISLRDHLAEGETIARETFYWHYPHYHKTNPGSVIRDGDFKLFHYYEDDRLELYNLKEDVAESMNLAGKMPEMADSLFHKLNIWLENENAKMPSPNPAYNPDYQSN